MSNPIIGRVARSLRSAHWRRRQADLGTERSEARDTSKAAILNLLAVALGDSSLGAGADREWLSRSKAKLSACRTARAFREAQCGQYLVRPESCDLRVCPDCAAARARRLIERAKSALATISPARRSYIVLTIRNCADLKNGLRLLSSHFAALRRRALFKGGRCHTVRRDGHPFHPCAHPTHPRSRDRAGDRNCPAFRHRPVLGGFRFDEVTYNPLECTWHPHANLLIDAPFILQAELADTWCTITCPDHRGRGCPTACVAGSPVVWIRKVDPGTVLEAIKYVTKPAALVAGGDPRPLIEFLLVTRGRRLFQAWGSLYRLDLEEHREPEETVVVTSPFDPWLRHRLPRKCPMCQKDTLLENGQCTWETPILVPRREVRIRLRVAVWRPPSHHLPNQSPSGDHAAASTAPGDA